MGNNGEKKLRKTKKNNKKNNQAKNGKFSTRSIRMRENCSKTSRFVPVEFESKSRDTLNESISNGNGNGKSV